MNNRSESQLRNWVSILATGWLPDYRIPVLVIGVKGYNHPIVAQRVSEKLQDGTHLYGWKSVPDTTINYCIADPTHWRLLPPKDPTCKN